MSTWRSNGMENNKFGDISHVAYELHVQYRIRELDRLYGEGGFLNFLRHRYNEALPNIPSIEEIYESIGIESYERFCKYTYRDRRYIDDLLEHHNLKHLYHLDVNRWNYYAHEEQEFHNLMDQKAKDLPDTFEFISNMESEGFHSGRKYLAKLDNLTGNYTLFRYVSPTMIDSTNPRNAERYHFLQGIFEYKLFEIKEDKNEKADQ